MPRGFDWIAPFYDSLARLVFGDSIRRCQVKYLNKIPPGGTVLMLGGGTGWLLEELKKANPSCTVWYVESSLKMLETTRARFDDLSNRGIVFIHGTEKDLQEFNNTTFDAVITNFYLDLFAENSLDDVLRSIRQHIYPGGKFVVSDFVKHAWWQKLLLFIMYRFFRWTCGIEAKTLPDWQRQLKSAGFEEQNTTPFYGGFISASLYVFGEK